MRVFLVLIALLLFPPSLHQAMAQSNQDLLDVAVEGTSKATTAPEATREIQAWAASSVARDHVINILGEKRYQKNKAAIESKIVRQSAKFIPFTNPGSPSQAGDGTWKMPVELRVSLASLRRVILDAGFLNDADGPASILPTVSFLDRDHGSAYRWWVGANRGGSDKFLLQLSQGFHDTFQAEFSKQGFHIVKPLSTTQSPVPEVHRVERPGKDDIQFFSDYFKAPMIMRGDVRLRSTRNGSGAVVCAFRLQVLHGESGRIVAELTRQVVTSPGSFEPVVKSAMDKEVPEIARDLSTQVLDAWQRGTLNTNLARVTVRGALSAQQQAELKSGLLKSVRDVKALTERSIASNQVVYEVDYTGTVPELAQKLRTAQIPGFQTRLAENTEKGVILDVRSSSKAQ